MVSNVHCASPTILAYLHNYIGHTVFQTHSHDSYKHPLIQMQSGKGTTGNKTGVLHLSAAHTQGKEANTDRKLQMTKCRTLP